MKADRKTRLADGGVSGGIMNFNLPYGLPLGFFLLIPALMLAGVGASIYFRRRPWVPVIWVPTIATFTYGSFQLLTATRILVATEGSGSNWARLYLIFLTPSIVLCIGGLISCLVYFPRGGWDWRALLAGLGFTAAIPAAWNGLAWSRTCDVSVRVLDAHGDVVADAVSSSGEIQGEEGSGVLRFKLQRGDQMEFDVSRESAVVPVFYQMKWRPSTAAPGSIEVRHSWVRTVGYETKLDESFAEIIPYSKRIVVSVVLPSGDDLQPVPDRDRFRKVFDSIKRAPARDDLSYSDVCGNLAALDFIPDLIAGGRGHRFANMQGLKKVAETLARMDEGCRDLRRRINGSTRQAPEMELRGNVALLCEWAGVPFGPTSGAETLDQVERKLAERARPLVNLCLQDSHGDNRSPYILSELGTLNRMYLEEFVARLLETPPMDRRQAADWSRVFHRMEARKSELKPLVESPNPLLQAVTKGLRAD